MHALSLAQQTHNIKSKAKALGFDNCGISRAGFLEEEARRLELWLRQGRHGTMSWMENWFDKRVDPTKLMEGAKSVITVLLNYAPADDTLSMGPFKISRYAYGQDYHDVLKKKLS
ncbi:MAG: yjeS [Chitinophagaceae bacterium]|nr:yjeS [Chitinophagaceae bacterium]